MRPHPRESFSAGRGAAEADEAQREKRVEDLSGGRVGPGIGRGLSLKEAFAIAHGQAAVEQDCDAAYQHAEIGARFVEKTQQPIVAEQRGLESAEAVPEKDGNFCRNEGRKDHDEEQKSGVSCVDSEHEGRAGHNLDHAHEGRQQEWIRQSDVRKAARAQFAWQHELEKSLGEKDQADDHTDEDHWQVFAHRASPARKWGCVGVGDQKEA